MASGLLTGKFSKDHEFEEDDHRSFNKAGEAFNVGETFGGLPFEKGVELSRKISWIGNERNSITHAALKWVMQQESVTTVIPGFKNEQQVVDNLKALEVKKFSKEEIKRVESFYWEEVHNYIRGAY